MKSILACIFLFFFGAIAASNPPSADKEFRRLDPHGHASQNFREVTSLKNHQQCSVCHADGSGRLKLKANLDQVCSNCHNKSPHSGVAEHMGKSMWGSPIQCSTCHAPHRGEGGKARVKRDCTECHKW